jgi:hypothetical protein
MNSFEQYAFKKRQFEQRKLQPQIDVAEPVQVAVKPVLTRPPVTAEQIVTGGLLGDYQELDILLLAIEEQNARRSRAKKGTARDTENELALRKFKPIIEAWINAKVILDRKIFALVVYFAIGCGDYPLLIAMCDLSIELGIIDFEPTLKREMQGFIVDEVWEVCKKDYWYQPDGSRTKKRMKKPMPDWFWVIFERVVTTKAWPTIWYKQNMMFQIAGYDCVHRGDKKAAIEYWSQCNELSDRSGVKLALKELLAQMASS